MTGIVQTLGDLRLIVTTDRRVWAAGGFLCIVCFVWVVTGAWRPPDEEPPEEYVRVKVEDDKIRSMVAEFNKSLKEGVEERKFLKESITRVAQDVQVGKEEVDWNVNVLMNKLNDITEKVDGLANKVGASTIERAQFEEKLKQQKKDSKKKKPVDRSML